MYILGLVVALLMIIMGIQLYYYFGIKDEKDTKR